MTPSDQSKDGSVDRRMCHANGGPGRDQFKIAGLCLHGSNSGGFCLEAALKAAQSVEVVYEALCEADFMNSSSKLCSRLRRFQPGLLLLCLPKGAESKIEHTFEVIRQCHLDLPLLVILESGEPQELQRLMALGAADFCLLPLRSEDFVPRLRRWHRSGASSNEVLSELNQKLGLDKFIGSSPTFIEAIRRIPKLAKCDASIFITGETGTGKEMCARAIHHLGPRAGHPFVPVNCGAIPLELVENELFGHEAGAFTGASSAAKGLIHDAQNGTLFLDEIDSLPLQTQVKLLRFLQDQEYRPLGARKTCQADVRIIAACNSDPEGIVRSGKFRADLFYRLNILPLKLPALRERREDISILATHFIAKYAQDLCMPKRELSRTAVDKLQAYDWPGNVRELENTMARALVLCEQPLITSDDVSLPETVCSTEEMSFKVLKSRVIAEFESSYIRRLLASNEGNISKAARAAKKNRRAFWQLMRKHDIIARTDLIARGQVGRLLTNSRTDLS